MIILATRISYDTVCIYEYTVYDSKCTITIEFVIGIRRMNVDSPNHSNKAVLLSYSSVNKNAITFPFSSSLLSIKFCKVISIRDHVLIQARSILNLLCFRVT